MKLETCRHKDFFGINETVILICKDCGQPAVTKESGTIAVDQVGKKVDFEIKDS